MPFPGLKKKLLNRVQIEADGWSIEAVAETICGTEVCEDAIHTLPIGEFLIFLAAQLSSRLVKSRESIAEIIGDVAGRSAQLQ